MITNVNKVSEKMIYLLRATLTPILDDFKFEFDKS